MEQIEQPHGGKLNKGGTPGNKGGGAVKNKYREAATLSAGEAITLLTKYLEEIRAQVEGGKSVRDVVRSADLCRCLEVLGKYGLGEIAPVIENEAVFHAFKDAMIEAEISADTMKSVFEGVKERLS